MRKMCRRVMEKRAREDNGEYQPSARPAQKLAGQPKPRWSKAEKAEKAEKAKCGGTRQRRRVAVKNMS